MKGTNTMTEQIKETNYEIFLKTINSLKHSQGFYSRLARDVAELDDEQKEQLKNELNSKPQWNDTLDCVFFLEG
ncbi:MAG: hypothetical protein K5656_01760 [Lachnospiraceae bacterium]|nr:hypothetical protein [Lachnospiraceae bacterium]